MIMTRDFDDNLIEEEEYAENIDNGMRSQMEPERGSGLQRW
jgi:hypothetical protein